MSNEKKSERFTIVMAPRELADLDQWALAHGAISRAEAVRNLVRLGMMASETPEELAVKCAEAIALKKSNSWLMQHYLEDHPRVTHVVFDASGMEITYGDHIRIGVDRAGEWWLTDISRPEE